MLFNAEGVIQKYATPEDILRDFYDLRLQFYAKRRSALLRVRPSWEGGRRARRQGLRSGADTQPREDTPGRRQRWAGRVDASLLPAIACCR